VPGSIENPCSAGDIVRSLGTSALGIDTRKNAEVLMTTAIRALIGATVLHVTALSIFLPIDYLAARGQTPGSAERGAMKVYLAGPLGFSEAGRAFYNGEFVPKVRSLGFGILDPWSLTPQSEVDAVANRPEGPKRREAWRKLNVKIAGRNRAALDECDAVLAILDGVDVDSGTAAEIGYAFAKGKPILGYRGDFRLSVDNEGATVNLQVEYFIRQSGGDIVKGLAELPNALQKIAELVRRR
jgi:nucleoside 2-deoxyribosyltransferase